MQESYPPNKTIHRLNYVEKGDPGGTHQYYIAYTLNSHSTQTHYNRRRFESGTKSSLTDVLTKEHCIVCRRRFNSCRLVSYLRRATESMASKQRRASSCFTKTLQVQKIHRSSNIGHQTISKSWATLRKYRSQPGSMQARIATSSGCCLSRPSSSQSIRSLPSLSASRGTQANLAHFAGLSGSKPHVRNNVSINANERIARCRSVHASISAIVRNNETGVLGCGPYLRCQT